MTTAIVAVLVFTLIFAFIYAPLFFIARDKNRPGTIKNFGIAAVILGLLCVAVAITSERLVDQCFAADNLDCDDRGGAGLQVVFVVGFAIATWTRAMSLERHHRRQHGTTPQLPKPPAGPKTGEPPAP